MNLFEMLHKDHEKVKDLFEKIEKKPANFEELFATLKTELEVHAQAEEKFYYSELKDGEESHEITLEALEEHKVAKRLLKELDSQNKDTDQWMAKLKVLRENVEHHIEEEEKELFEKSKKDLDKSELEAIAEDIEEFKEEQLQTRGG